MILAALCSMVRLVALLLSMATIFGSAVHAQSAEVRLQTQVYLRNRIGGDIARQQEVKAFLPMSVPRFEVLTKTGRISPGPVSQFEYSLLLVPDDGSRISRFVDAISAAHALARRDYFFKAMGVPNFTKYSRSYAERFDAGDQAFFQRAYELSAGEIKTAFESASTERGLVLGLNDQIFNYPLVQSTREATIVVAETPMLDHAPIRGLSFRAIARVHPPRGIPCRRTMRALGVSGAGS